MGGWVWEGGCGCVGGLRAPALGRSAPPPPAPPGVAAPQTTSCPPSAPPPRTHSHPRALQAQRYGGQVLVAGEDDAFQVGGWVCGARPQPARAAGQRGLCVCLPCWPAPVRRPPALCTHPPTHPLPTHPAQVVEQWEPVTEADVQTPLEVYRELASDGCAARAPPRAVCFHAPPSSTPLPTSRPTHPPTHPPAHPPTHPPPDAATWLTTCASL